MSCDHKDFSAQVNVIRIEDKGRFMAEVRITCLDCGIPMNFMGVKSGFDPNGATVSLDGQELTIGIYPEGQQPNPLQQMLGYSVTNTN